MTSSGRCHKCEKVCYQFHYNTPHKGTGNHDGYWYCEDHGPIITNTSETLMDFSNKANPLTAGMNRADRRYFKKHGKVRA